MNPCGRLTLLLTFFVFLSFFINDCISFTQQQQPLNNNCNNKSKRRMELNNNNNNNNNEKQVKISPTTNNDNDDEKKEESSSVMEVHFIFLIHGWMGNDLEMGYIETSIRKQMCSNMNIVVYKPKCNVDKTFDGIELGADRLVHELSTFITQHITSTFPTKDKEVVASLNFVGNSLGGLYARNVISKLPLTLQTKNKQQQQTVIKLIPLMFVTTATPHLGCSNHTYVKIPKWLERMIGRLFRKTGRDLFASTEKGIIPQMNLDSHYLLPLQQYKKRVAYVNAFQTDFQVPTATAAFLSPSSTYLHQQVPSFQHHSPPDIVATFLTQPNHTITTTTPPNHDDEEDMDIHTKMSIYLDSLGWTKVFIDLRPHVPTYQSNNKDENNNNNDSMKQSTYNPSKQKPQTNNNDDGNNNNHHKDANQQQQQQQEDEDEDEESTPMLSSSSSSTTEEKKCTREIWQEFVEKRSKHNKTVWVTSQELKEYMSPSQNLHFPTGHSIMIANTKNDFQAKFNAKGRPVVDYIVSELLKDILHYTYQHNEEHKHKHQHHNHSSSD